MTILAIGEVWQVMICLLDDAGTCTHTVEIGELDGSEMSAKYHALTLANEKGWQASGAWGEDGELPWVEVAPIPLTLTFAGGEISEEIAINCAKVAGYEPLSVVKQTVVPEHGKNFITFALGVPVGWDWGTSPFE